MMKRISLLWPFVFCIVFTIVVTTLVSWVLLPSAGIPPGSELTPKMERAFGKSDSEIIHDMITYEHSLYINP